MVKRNNLSQNYLFDYLVVLAVGLGILLFFYFQSFPKLSWSDEIVYAVMGRNIVTGRGVLSNFYHPNSIVEKGFPLGDVHVPGHTFFLALSFLLLGQTEYAAIFPNHVSFLLSGLLLFWVSSNLFNRWAGFYTVLLFYLFPPIISYANSAMSELTLILMSIVYFVVWYKSLTNSKIVYILLLAIVLGLGMTIRETFLILLPSALYVLWQWPKQAQIKAGLYFGLTFVAYVIFIFWPFYQARAPYPHFLSNIVNLETLGAIFNALFDNIITNIRAIPLFGQAAWQLVYTVQYLTMLVIALLYFWFSKVQKRVAIYVLFSYFGSFLGLIAIYPFSNWAGVRAFMFTIPPALILIGSVITSFNPVWLRYATISLVACFLLYISLQANQALTEDRLREYERGQQYSRIIMEHTAQLQPRTVMMDLAFLYGWQAYPVNVIWQVPKNPVMASALEETVAIDVIVVKEEDKDRLIDGVRQGTLKGNYQLVNETPFEERYIFVNGDGLSGN